MTLRLPLPCRAEPEAYWFDMSAETSEGHPLMITEVRAFSDSESLSRESETPFSLKERRSQLYRLSVVRFGRMLQSGLKSPAVDLLAVDDLFEKLVPVP